ncbi:hypothetical protein EDC94DRAFT_618770 [Helicostylum pulchrum]|nr:hypothetical protein EDC94DRAFT_618770 [Helicostylum pulchrum]
MKDKISNPITGRVETLIETQISKTTEGRIDVIILVGGFSRNSYLRQRLTRTFRSIRIVIPSNAVTAISEVVTYNMLLRCYLRHDFKLLPTTCF